MHKCLFLILVTNLALGAQKKPTTKIHIATRMPQACLKEIAESLNDLDVYDGGVYGSDVKLTGKDNKVTLQYNTVKKEDLVDSTNSKFECSSVIRNRILEVESQPTYLNLKLEHCGQVG